MRNIFLILAFVVAFFAADIAQANPLTVSAVEHPRLLFHYDEIDGIRANVQDVNHPFHSIFNDLKADAQHELDDGKTGRYYQSRYLLADILWQGSPDYDQRFFNAIKGYVQGQLDSNSRFSGEGGAALRFDITALFYDWCYDAIPTSMREEIADAFVEDNYGYVYNYSKYWIWNEGHNKTWHYFAAVVNDFNSYGGQDQYTNADIVGQLENYVDHLDSHLLPCWDSFTNSAMDGYGGLRAASQMSVADWFGTYTNYDPLAVSTYLNNFQDFWKARLRPDGGWSRMPAKYNIENMGPYYFAWFGNALGDGESQWIANQFLIDGKIGGWEDGAAFFAWYDDDAAETPLNTQTPEQLEFYDEKLGFFLGRSDYDLFNDDQTITVGFFNGPDTQSHRTQNHLFVAKGDRNLLLDYNQYAGDLSSNYTFYKDTYAHNSITIWRPNSDPGYSEFEDCSTQQGPAPWFGGQLSSNDEIGDQLYATCNGLYGYRGEIVEEDFTPYFAYLVGDATEVYKDRASKVLRRFLLLRPGVIFVQDYIGPQGLASANDTIWAGVYHTINQPIIDGTINTINRGTMVGGDMYTVDTNRLTASVEDASVSVYYLGQNNIRIIGGPNSIGKYWQQNHDPSGNDSSGSSSKYDTYVTNDDISFEFYNPFAGNNYVPFRCGSPPSIYDFERRNRSTYNSEYYNANSAGQWSFMVEKTPNGTQPIVVNQIIYVPENGDPNELDFTVVDNGGTPVVTVNYKDQSYTVEMGDDGFVYYPNFETIGACCVPPMSQCELRSETACDAVGGAYLGDNTSCTPIICDAPVDPPVDPEDPQQPCDPDTVYVDVIEYVPSEPDTIIEYVEIPVEVPVEVPVYLPCEPDTLNLELNLQMIVPEGTHIEIKPQ